MFPERRCCSWSPVWDCGLFTLLLLTSDRQSVRLNHLHSPSVLSTIPRQSYLSPSGSWSCWTGGCPAWWWCPWWCWSPSCRPPPVTIRWFSVPEPEVWWWEWGPDWVGSILPIASQYSCPRTRLPDLLVPAPQLWRGLAWQRRGGLLASSGQEEEIGWTISRSRSVKIFNKLPTGLSGLCISNKLYFNTSLYLATVIAVIKRSILIRNLIAPDQTVFSSMASEASPSTWTLRSERKDSLSFLLPLR